MIFICSLVIPAEHIERSDLRKYGGAVERMEAVFACARRNACPDAAGSQECSVAVSGTRADFDRMPCCGTDTESPSGNIAIAEDHLIRCADVCIRSDRR